MNIRLEDPMSRDDLVAAALALGLAATKKQAMARVWRQSHLLAPIICQDERHYYFERSQGEALLRDLEAA